MRLIRSVLAAVMVMGITVFGLANPAAACSPALGFFIQSEHLFDAELLDADYAEFAENYPDEVESDEPPRILAVEKIEVIEVADGDAEWTNSGVEALTLAWGEVRDSPELRVSVDEAVERGTEDPCWNPAREDIEVGDAKYWVETDQGNRWFSDLPATADQDFDATFGTATVIVPNSEKVADQLATLGGPSGDDASTNRSLVLIAAASAGFLAAAAAVLYLLKGSPS